MRNCALCGEEIKVCNLCGSRDCICDFSDEELCMYISSIREELCETCDTHAAK